MRTRNPIAPLVAALLVLAAPSMAQAQVWLTPYAGSSLSIDFAGYDPGRAWHYGGSLSLLNAAGIGIELDAAVAPDFFDPGRSDFGDIAGGGQLATLMANVMWALPSPGVRPYVSAGAGLIRSRLEAPFDLFTYTDNAVGWNAGGGIRVGGKIGLRADVRYFRQVDDVSPFSVLNVGDFSYWRGTIGLSLGL